MAKIAVLTGNGLSVALSLNFSLPNITKRFFNRIKPEYKALVDHHMSDKNDKSDFEKCVANVEKFYDDLHHHQNLFKSVQYGKTFIEVNSLDLHAMEKHEKSILESIYLFSALIVEMINGHVKHLQIDSRLPGFVKWLTSIVDSPDEVDIFTLNFDLLLETILLQMGRDKFMDFHHQAGPWEEIGRQPRFYLNPIKAMKIAGDCKVKLHHLYGSLSTFKDLKKESKENNKGVFFKLTTESIRKYSIYERIFDLNIVPTIITGGRKSEKIHEKPFNFYYNEFVEKMCDPGKLCDKLYIIGYGFRDDHINSAISERLKLAIQTNPRPLELTIVDYATTNEQKTKFIEHINTKLKLTDRPFIEKDPRILFGGANNLQVIV